MTRPGAGPPPAGRWAELDVLVAHCQMAAELVQALTRAPREQTTGLRLRVAATVDGAGEPDVLLGYQFPPGSLRPVAGLRWLHLTGTGTEHLAPAGLRPATMVTTSARVPVVAVAEYALSGLLLLVKDLVGVAAGRPRPWFSSRATLLAGSTAAVLGAGRVGRALLARLSALGAATVAVTRPGAQAVPEADRTIGTDRLTAAAGGFDHLLACLPGGDGTRHLVGAEVLAALPAHAYLVNVGRASTVDTAALLAALRAGRLAGAFLDVHDVEPVPPGHPARQVPGLVISPHCAFRFPAEPAGVAAAFLANLDDVRHGRTPRDVVAWHPERSRP